MSTTNELNIITNSMDILPSQPSHVSNMPFDAFIDVGDNQHELSERLEIIGETAVPPPPPTEDDLYLGNFKRNIRGKQINLGNGKMDFINCEISREMLENAWLAINLTENWDFVAQDNESFMFSKDNRKWIITEKMEKLGYEGHSGFSFGWTIRHMQFLAKNGIEKFKENW